MSALAGSMLERYKDWVRRHPGVVQNFDWLLLLTVWNPARASGDSEFMYEAYHAAIGLLSLCHQSILEEGELPTPRPAPYLWLDALEYVETLVELRGIYLEERGKMSRYGPLLAVELVRACLKMGAWGRYSGHCFLRHPAPDDLHQFESELGLQDVLASLERLRRRYSHTQAGRVAPDADDAPQLVGPAAAAEQLAPRCCGSPGGAAGANSGGGCSGATRAAAPARGACSYGLGRYARGLVGCWFRGGSHRGGDASAAACRPEAVAGAGGGDAAAGACNPRGGGCRVELQGPGPGRSREQAEQQAEQEEEAEERRAGEERRASGAAGSASPRCTRAAAAAAAATAAGGSCRADPWAAGLGWDWTHSSRHPRPPPPPPAGQAHSADADGCTGAGEAGGGGGSGLCGLRAELSRRAAARCCGVEDPELVMGRNLVWLGELLAIWRPVLYVSLLKRYGRRSWRPWLVSLSVDLLSGHFHRRGGQHLAAAEAAEARRAAEAVAAEAAEGPSEGPDAAGEARARAVSTGAAPGPGRGPGRGAGTSLLSLALARSLAAPGPSPGEQRELSERRRRLLLYGLRSPFLEACTLSALSRLRAATCRVPLLGLGADYLHGLADTLTAYYTYTSGAH